MSEEKKKSGVTVTKENIEGLMETVRNLYLCDDIPWVIGYSGGKDSTATLQLVWLALSSLPVESLKKQVHIIKQTYYKAVAVCTLYLKKEPS